MRNVILVAVLLISPGVAYSGYDANISGVPTEVLTYAWDGRIYVRLDVPHPSHPTCDNDYFAIDAAIPAPVFINWTTHRSPSHSSIVSRSRRMIRDRAAYTVPTEICNCSAADSIDSPSIIVKQNALQLVGLERSTTD